MSKKKKLRYIINTNLGYYAGTDYDSSYDMEEKGLSGWHTYGPGYKHEKLMFSDSKADAKTLIQRGLTDLAKRLHSIVELGLEDITWWKVEVREVE